jgi:hypothetical protein
MFASAYIYHYSPILLLNPANPLIPQILIKLVLCIYGACGFEGRLWGWHLMALLEDCY